MAEDQDISTKNDLATPTDVDDLAGKNGQNEDQITFDDFDKLNLNSLGMDILRIIEEDKDFARDQKACTISLNAGFGQGKTTFLEMLKDFIEKQKDQEGRPDPYTVLFIDAWRDDFSKEPIIAILLKFLEYLEKNQNGQIDQIVKRVYELIGSFTIESSVFLAKKSVGVYLQSQGVNPGSLKKIWEWCKDRFKKASEQKENIGQKLFKEFQQRQKALVEIKSIISDYTRGGKRLVVIVDELDRARPDYAVHFLEDIKHFFDIENVVFIFGINKSQMEATVKILYGQDLDFDGYYAKFFKHEIDLPDPYIEALNFVENLLQELNVSFEKFGPGLLFDSDERVKQEHRSNNLIKIYLCCKMFNLTLREINSFLRILESVLKEQAKSNSYFHTFYLSAIIFFTCLYVKKRNIFTDILNGTFRLEDFLEFISKEDFKGLLTIESNYSIVEYIEPHSNKNDLSYKENPQQIIDDINTWKKGILFAVTISLARCHRSSILKEDLRLIKREFPNYEDQLSPLDTKGQGINLCHKIAKRKFL